MLASVGKAEDDGLQLDRTAWEKSIKNMNYEPDKKRERKPREAEETTLPDLSGFKYVAYGMVVLIVVVLLVLILRNARPVEEVKHERIEAQTLEEAEENLPMVTLNRIYEEAMAMSDFKKALRIKFLMVLQSLIDARMIVWKKRKTNEQYLHELQDENIFRMFRSAVQTFDDVWYGELLIDASQYSGIIASLDQLNSTIANGEPK
ncbi:MAG: hypothetical protein GC178_05305 [Flavobacteriales bacterium]|nr:hypothetical protein [Flavobacteriales bacterium]